MSILIKDGTIIDPGNLYLSEDTDVLIENDKIIGLLPRNGCEYDINNQFPNVDRIIDASGKYVVTGLIDMHVHLREPGYEYKETISSGCMAASAGGFVSICAMPNTNPINDNRQVTEFIIKQANDAAKSMVYPIAAISKGSKGNELCEYSELKDAGVVAFSDDGWPVINSLLMRRAMEYAKVLNMPIISHCEDIYLSEGGSMNDGPTATKLGLIGIPNACESIMVMRDIALCELTGVQLHIAHVSTKESVEAIRMAKKRGISVTAETAPHYFTLTEKAVALYNTNAKMNPPLRSQKDREAIIEGLIDGTIDVIATDHAPHSILEKNVEFDKASNGIVGLETSLSLTLKLFHEGIISFKTIIEKMSKNPARILGLKNNIEIGGFANLTIIDPNISYIVDSKKFYSKSRNMPFDNIELKGKSVFTFVNGKITFEQ
ncbi:MAG: dihydroorotase [Desulfobacterales bacterium]|nr:dihydroorotase [Desulfobacterales bacterium]